MAEVDGLGRERKARCKHGHPYDETNTYWSINWKGYKCRGCRACQRERMRRKRENPERKKLDREKSAKWREAHPEKYRESWEGNHEKKKQSLLDARASGCAKCGENDPSCLDFHHRDPDTKEGDIGKIRRYSMKRLLAEIAKCDVLCANCHRKHHRDQREGTGDFNEWRQHRVGNQVRQLR